MTPPAVRTPLRLLVNFPPYTRPDNSMGIYCRDVVAELEARGHEVTFCSIAPSRLTRANVSVPSRLRTGVSRLDCLTLYLLMAGRLGRCDGVVNMSHEFIFPLRLGRSVNLIYDTTQLEFPRSRFVKLMLAPSWAMARRSRLNITCSHASAADLAALGVRAEVVYSHFEVEAFQAVRSRRSPVPRFAAVWCGTAAPHKNLPLYLDLCRRHPERAFALVAPAFDLAAIGHDRPSNVELFSGLSFEGYLDLLSQSALMVSTSLKEGYGRPPMEALLAGMPALVSDIPVYREIYEGLATFHDLTPEGLDQGFGARLAPAPATLDPMLTSRVGSVGQIVGKMMQALKPA